MAQKLALWSLTLLPGEKVPIYIRNDFEITNVALPEDLVDESGRSVVKVTYHPINPALLGDDSDSEIDSDDEDSLLGSPSEDEFELDEEEGFKEVAKKGKANGVEADMSEDDEDEDEEEDDEEDSEEDSDFDFDEEPEVTNVICSLTAGKNEQAQVNLTFCEGDAVMFEVTGKNAVHLLGNYIRQPHGHSHDDDSSDDEDEFDSDDYDDYDGLYDDEDDDEEEEVSIGKITEIPADKPKKAALAEAAAAPAAAEKKRKADAIESPSVKAEAGETLSKKQKKKLAQEAVAAAVKAEAKPVAAAKPAAAAPAPAKGNKTLAHAQRTLPSGLVIEDVKLGEGKPAKRGSRLGMRYIGKLTTGKQFDANTGGKPFSFTLGRGEVIKGWDEGLEGMKVGGERKLSIPPALAYGNQKIPGIPKGSTLNFEVKLVTVG